MSTCSSGDTPSPMPLDGGQMKREAVPELVQLYQAQSASAIGSQGSGARDMFKAGHRRLRQLAMRQRKTSDPKSKAEEASRQLLALQEEGFLPAPKAKKPASSKKSIDSTISASQSTTNLSFKSDSRRDVERIGQPWLGDPLERVHSHELNTQLSSLDLRELTSLVEAAVSLPSQIDDAHPPPYQPSPQPTPAPNANLREKPLSNTPSHESMNANKPSNEQARPAQMGDGPSDPKESGPQQPNTQTTQAPSNPTSQTLKLFPDTLPPRVSSKAAWRISNSRSPGPNRGLPPVETLRIPTSASHPGLASSKGPANGISKGQTTSAKHSQGNRSLTNSPIHERFPQHRNPRRPASLPLGSIHSFPLPAPMRPLPSLPEPVAGINTTRGQPLPAGKRLVEAPKSPSLQPPFNSSAEKQETNSTKTGDQPRLILPGTPPKSENGSVNGKESEDSKKNETIQPGITPFVRMGQSRAERVRALKFKDMSASRLHLTGDSPKRNGVDLPLRSPRFQATTIPEKIDEVPDSSQGPGESKKDTERPVSKQGAGDSLSTPALNLQPAQSNQQHQPTNTRSCSSPLHFNRPTTQEATQRASLSASSRGPALSRSNSARSTKAGQEKQQQSSHSREIYNRAEAETPIPSSDDECMGQNKYTHHPRGSPTKRRRLKPAPIVSDAAAQKHRHEKKQSSRGYTGPTTPRKKRSRAFERMSPQSQSTCCSQDSRDSRHYRDSYVLSLEGRITHLERQNKVLQAALMAALDLGEKPSLETLLGGSASSFSTPHTGRSFSSFTNSSSFEEPLPPLRHERYPRSKSRAAPYQPENWIASPGSSGSNYTDDSVDGIRELEDMMEDFDFGWMSDKSSFDRVQRPTIRT